MSFILDALRKSENQRRLGQAPTLADTGALSAAPAQRIAAARWPWLVGLTALLVTVLIWLWWQAGTGDAHLVPGPAPDTQAQRTAKQTPSSTIPEPARSAPTRSVVENFRPAEPPAEITRTIPTVNNASQQSQSEAAPESGPAPDNDQQSRLVQSQDGSVATTPELEAPGRRPLDFFELPASIRSEVGELNVTMQVYSPDPAGRFAIINRRRVAENQELKPGLEVTEIRRQGVVLQYKDYRFIIGD